MESEKTAECICTLQNIKTPRRVWIIHETDFILLRICAWYKSWCHSKKMMSSILFNFISNPCKSYDIKPFIRIISIEGRVVKVCSEIFYVFIETLKSWKFWWHIFCSDQTGCVANVNSYHDSNVLYLSKSVSTFSMIFPLCLLK